MTHKEALARIKELEALVKLLAARPLEVHHHNDFAGLYIPPQYPAPCPNIVTVMPLQYPAPCPNTTPGAQWWQNPIIC